MPWVQDQFGEFYAPAELSFSFAQSLGTAQEIREHTNGLLAWWFDGGVGNPQHDQLPGRLDNVGWGHIAGDGGPRVWREIVRPGDLPVALRHRIEMALLGGLSYAEVLSRMAPEVRAAGLGATADSFEAAAAAAASAPQLSEGQTRSALSKRDPDHEIWAASYGRVAGRAESEQRARAGDPKAAAWKAREKATRVALGWAPQTLSTNAASIAAGRKVAPMSAPFFNPSVARAIAPVANRMNQAPVLVPRQAQASASVSGTSETAIWIVAGLAMLGGVYYFASKKRR